MSLVHQSWCWFEGMIWTPPWASCACCNQLFPVPGCAPDTSEPHLPPGADPNQDNSSSVEMKTLWNGFIYCEPFPGRGAGIQLLRAAPAESSESLQGSQSLELGMCCSCCSVAQGQPGMAGHQQEPSWGEQDRKNSFSPDRILKGSHFPNKPESELKEALP